MDWQKRNRQAGTGPLTGLQLDVLRALWTLGEATIASAHAALPRRDELRPVSVGTILRRLERRGLVAHRLVGRAHHFRALVTEEQVTRRAVDAAVEQVFEGDLTAFAAQLVRREDVTAADLARIRALIEARERELERDGNCR